MAHPLTTNGRYSKDLPTRMAADFNAALADPDLIVMRGEAAVLEARLADLLRRADTGEAGATWLALSESAREFRAAMKRGDTDFALALARDMAKLADKGKADHMTWTDVLRTVEALRRVKESERKRLESAHSVLTADKAMLLVAALTDAVRRHVSDRAALSAIGRDVERLIGASGALDTGGVGADGG